MNTQGSFQLCALRLTAGMKAQAALLAAGNEHPGFIPAVCPAADGWNEGPSCVTG